MKAKLTDYEKRGVSQDKTGVIKAAKTLGEGVVKNTFAKVLPDSAGDKRYASIPHEDGSGTKILLAYLKWKETGDARVFRGVAQDAIVMNLDDIFCTTANPTKLQMSMVINRNKHLIPDAIINEIITGAKAFCIKLKKWGIDIEYVSGETADMGDVVRTITLDVSMTARTLRSDIISLDKIDADNIIIGLSSCGRTPWEDVYNSGIGSNGFTNARHDVLSPYYKKRYPETFSPETDKKLIYRGEYKLGDEVPVFFGMSTSGMNIGELLLSPTRTYAPFLRALHKELGAKDYKKLITGVIHNSGGGQKKVLSYLRPGLRVWKSALHSVLQPPPVFGLLFGAMEKHASSFHKKEKELLWEAYKTFNMGQRMEIYCKDEKTAATIISLAGSMNLGAFVIGEVLVSGARYKRDVVIKTFSGMEVVYELTS